MTSAPRPPPVSWLRRHAMAAMAAMATPPVQDRPAPPRGVKWRSRRRAGNIMREFLERGGAAVIEATSFFAHRHRQRTHSLAPDFTTAIFRVMLCTQSSAVLCNTESYLWLERYNCYKFFFILFFLKKFLNFFFVLVMLK